ncbi:MAG: 5-guanidino-2-oxopentanoate decarboxylase [Paracoccaceae bacterium]|nr:5-guanidino-2-oxopentanoate decarboxylase [Paracoccaceae bacterium]
MMTCGEATMRLLARYGVHTVFGIPGVHTLDFCRGLGDGGAVRHVQVRNEQGAGFMAEGWARATGEPGVALVISGPGVTNASTALGQAYADSLPLLLISAEADSRSLGRGWGVLHEISEQKRVTEPLTALSATALRPDDIPVLMAQAFAIFRSGRPRPVHLSIPIDVQAATVTGEWEPVTPPARPSAPPAGIAAAADLLGAATSPLIMIGGGASAAGGDLVAIAESTGSIVVASTAGKGIVPDDHSLSLSATTVRPEVQRRLGDADVILAVGTELSETDSFVERLSFGGRMIRVDIDPAKINDLYPAHLGIVGDAGPAMAALRETLGGKVTNDRRRAEAQVRQIRDAIAANLTASEARHVRALDILAASAPPDTVWSGDACQLVYTGAFMLPVASPRRWFYPAGYCALGNALPNAIGASLARPGAPVAVLAGDGGFMFTMPELLTAADLGIPLPVIIWENGGLKQIQDDMDVRGIARVGVEGGNPDFVALARACRCHGTEPRSADELATVFGDAFRADRPTVIVLRDEAVWLQ